MNVYLTFDVEVWCDGWANLDARFPSSFERYCYGRSPRGDYALPKTLEIMTRHGLTGVFFVEPLFSARFGSRFLDTITGLIREAGQDIQLHLHPEWTDEIKPPILADVSKKRQHLSYYSVDEQSALIAFGRQLLETSKGAPVSAFRAGSFAANRDTYRALQRNGLLVDSSLNSACDYCGGTIDGMHDFTGHRVIEGVDVFPVTVFRDGLGSPRPAQVTAASFGELRRALESAHRSGVSHFVVVSHNFEMLKPDSSEPDRFVVRRFEALCAFLGQQRDRFKVGPFPVAPQPVKAEAKTPEPRPQARLWHTIGRHFEQAMRRVV